ncbi:MAG: ribosome-associated translation inhibitor RaiA [Candidatus Pacebacteria bacterium]|nr:ribosome-associated translation inhibitor RaiA [Candidatus Paceibacterota bacterium]
MNIQTKATNIEITPATTDYLEKRMGAIKKFISSEETILVEVDLGKVSNRHRTGDVFRVSVRLSSPHHDAQAEAESVDLYTAIDEVKDELLAELRTSKEKRQHFIRRSGQKIKNIIKGIIGR